MILNPSEEMGFHKELKNLIKYLMRNLKKEFHFNRNKICKKVQILINYLLGILWIIIHLIITINQLMKLSQAIQIHKIINHK